MPSAGPDRRLIIELGARNRTRGAIDSIKAQIRSIPTIRNIQIRAQLSGISGVRGQISGIRGKTVTVIARADAAAANTAIQGIKGSVVTVVVNAEIGAAQTAIDSIKGRSVTVVAAADIGAAQTAIQSIKGGTVTVAVRADVSGFSIPKSSVPTISVPVRPDMTGFSFPSTGIPSLTVPVKADMSGFAWPTTGMPSLTVPVTADMSGFAWPTTGMPNLTVPVTADMSGFAWPTTGMPNLTVPVTADMSGFAWPTTGMPNLTVPVTADMSGFAWPTTGMPTLSVAVEADMSGFAWPTTGMPNLTVPVTADMSGFAWPAIGMPTLTVPVTADMSGFAWPTTGMPNLTVPVTADMSGFTWPTTGMPNLTVPVTADMSGFAWPTTGMPNLIVPVTADMSGFAWPTTGMPTLSVAVEADMSGFAWPTTGMPTLSVAVEADMSGFAWPTTGMPSLTVPVTADMSGFAWPTTGMPNLTVPVTADMSGFAWPTTGIPTLSAPVEAGMSGFAWPTTGMPSLIVPVTADMSGFAWPTTGMPTLSVAVEADMSGFAWPTTGMPTLSVAVEADMSGFAWPTTGMPTLSVAVEADMSGFAWPTTGMPNLTVPVTADMSGFAWPTTGMPTLSVPVEADMSGFAWPTTGMPTLSVPVEADMSGFAWPTTGMPNLTVPVTADMSGFAWPTTGMPNLIVPVTADMSGFAWPTTGMPNLIVPVTADMSGFAWPTTGMPTLSVAVEADMSGFAWPTTGMPTLSVAVEADMSGFAWPTTGMPNLTVPVTADMSGFAWPTTGMPTLSVPVEADMSGFAWPTTGMPNLTVPVTADMSGFAWPTTGMPNLTVPVTADMSGFAWPTTGMPNLTVPVTADMSGFAWPTTGMPTLSVAVEADMSGFAWPTTGMPTLTVPVTADMSGFAWPTTGMPNLTVPVTADMSGFAWPTTGMPNLTVPVTADMSGFAWPTTGMPTLTVPVTADLSGFAWPTTGIPTLTVPVTADLSGFAWPTTGIPSLNVPVTADMTNFSIPTSGISPISVPISADTSGFSIPTGSLGPQTVSVTPTVDQNSKGAFGNDMKIFLDHFVAGGMGGFRIPVSIGALGPMALPIIGALGIAGGIGVAEKFGYARDSLFANDTEYQRLADIVRQGDKEESTDEQINEARKARIAMENMEEEWRLFVNEVITDQDSKATPIALTQTAEILRVNGIMLEKIMREGESGKTPLHVITESVTGLARGTESADELILLMADLATDAMIQFKKEPEDLEHISTLLAGMAKESKASLRDVAYFFSAGGGMASQSGITLEDFVTAGTIAMPYFRSGMDLGTSLKMMFQNMTLLTGKDFENLEKYGGLHEETMIYNKDLNSSTSVSGIPIFYTPEGATASDADIVSAIQSGFKGLSDFQRAGVVSETFGSSHVARVERIMKGEHTDKDIESLRKRATNLASSPMAAKYGLLHEGSVSYTTTETGERRVIGGTPIWFDRTYNEEEEKWDETFVGLPRFIEMMQDILEPMTGYERSKFLGETFGSDAIRAVAAVVDVSVEDWDAMQVRLLETTTEELAEIKKGNIKSEAQRMVSLLQAITIGIFKGADAFAASVLSFANTGLEFFLTPVEQDEFYKKETDTLQTKQELGIKLTDAEEIQLEKAQLHTAIQTQDPTAMLWAHKLLLRGVEVEGLGGTLMKIIAHMGIDAAGDREREGWDMEQVKYLMTHEVETWADLPGDWSDFLYGWLFDAGREFFRRSKEGGTAADKLGQIDQTLGMSGEATRLVEAGVSKGDVTALSNMGLTDWDGFAAYIEDLQKAEWRDWAQLDPEMRETVTYEIPEYNFDEILKLYQEFQDEQLAAARAQKAAASAEMQRRVAESASQGNINISGRETKYSAYGNEVSYEPMALEAPFFDESDLISGGVAYKDGQGIYVIKAGETLGELATRFGTTVDILVEMNDIADKNVIRTGAKLKIPTKEPLTKPDTTPIETLPIGPLTVEEQEILAQGGEIKTKPTQPKFTQPEDLVEDDTPLPDGSGAGIDPWLVDGQGEGESAPKITRPTPKPTPEPITSFVWPFGEMRFLPSPLSTEPAVEGSDFGEDDEFTMTQASTLIKIQYEETHIGEPLSFAQEIGFGLETEPGMVYPGMNVPTTTIPIQFDIRYTNEPGAWSLPSGVPYPGTHIQPYPVPSAVRYSDEPDFENEEMFGIGGEPAKYFTVTGEPYVTTEPGEEELTPRKPETPVEQLTRLGVGYLGSEPRATFTRPDMMGEHGEYTIKAGDTLGELATRFNTTIPILMQMNDITDRNEITTGTTLEIPTEKRVLSDAESPEIYVDEPNDGRPASSYTVSTKTNIIESIRAELADTTFEVNLSANAGSISSAAGDGDTDEQITPNQTGLKTQGTARSTGKANKQVNAGIQIDNTFLQ